jgi:mRNA interferase RelE/StbE
MNYNLIIRPKAERQLDRLSADVQARIRAAMGRLQNNPRPPGCLKMATGDRWRIRVGQYRVVYEIDDAARTVTVTDVGHRSDVY